MEQHPQPDAPAYLEMVPKLNQGIFFCFNESSERLPVSMVKGFSFNDHNTLTFSINYFPLTEQIWNVFAAEMHLYKKGIPFSIVLHGIAMISDVQNSLVQFTIQKAEYFEQPVISDGVLSTLFKPYMYFYRKGSELLSHTFSKKTLSTALHKFSAHAES
jgi:hypothetical protein